MLSQMIERLKSAEITVADVGDPGAASAAVLMALTDNQENPSVILTKRAEHMNSHRGQVAFPGGKWEPGDASLVDTALRESWEEVDLSPSLVQVISPLPNSHTRKGFMVTPYVGIVPEGLSLTANPDELDAVFEVPLSFFLEDHRLRTDQYSRDGIIHWSPAYQFGPYEIWGFTARVLATFLNQYAQANIRFESSAPVRDWGNV